MTSDVRYRFALAVHSPEISKKFHECTHFADRSIHTEIISFDNGATEARELLSQGYEVILCHGGTGESILREIGHSVVVIQKTDADVIRALLKAKAMALPGAVALTVHDNEFRELDLFQNILGMQIHQIRYASKDKLITSVEEVFRQGVRVVVGGGVSQAAIEALGGTGVIIEPNEHSILKALQRATIMAKAKREEASHREQLVAILKLLSEGVIFIDTEKNIVFSNHKARQYLKMPPKAASNFSKYLNELFLNAVLEDGVPRLDEIVSINGDKLVVNTLPVSIHSQLHGAVALFRDTASIQNINKLIHQKLHLRGLTATYTTQDIKGGSPLTRRLIDKIGKYAQNASSILIEGETGSGKELVAHSLHNLSARKSKPFVAVNCSALPDSLLESELFGYEEGAFTGAKRGGKIGLFELANQGTIFLDEIGDISHAMQLRLLRVLEAKEIMRVGGDRIVPIDVRIISASHRELKELVQQGRFRMDLYFRLGTLQLHVPPLRQRMEDIPALVEELVLQHGKRMDIFTPAMLEAMGGYGWPGNIRELLSFIESYFALLGDSAADEELFLELFTDRAMALREDSAPVPASQEGTLKEQLRHYRGVIIQNTLKRCLMNKRRASDKLGISYNTLWRILSGREEDGEGKGSQHTAG